MKCSFRLPYTSNEEEDSRENETAQSPGEAPFFNFDKQFDINEVFNLEIQQILILVTFCTFKQIVWKSFCIANK